MMNNVQEVYRGKSAKLAKYKRVEADQLYAKGNFERALMLYTQSVIRAPVAGMYLQL